MSRASVMQGDQYNLVFDLKIDGEDVDLTVIEKIQFQVGNVLKEFMPNSESSEVEYDVDEKLFFFPLTETETFAFNTPSVLCSIRVYFVGGIIKGTRVGYVNVVWNSIRKPLKGGE